MEKDYLSFIIVLNPISSHVAPTLYIQKKINLWVLNNASILITGETEPVELLT